jgi:hypothetical protein
MHVSFQVSPALKTIDNMRFMCPYERRLGNPIFDLIIVHVRSFLLLPNIAVPKSCGTQSSVDLLYFWERDLILR